MLRVLVLLCVWCVMSVQGLAYAVDPVVSPVVQLVSYRDIYGNSVEMLGRGSASIIDRQGTILTNNHVIDDGAGQPSSAFSVCVTTNTARKPDCLYTASLIARDATKDLAVLRIDPIDVNGNPVAYDQFPVLEIDYTYLPRGEDQVSAVGYPRIGAETISQTKGNVAGTIEYNGLTYIKTDTIIAGGNSGGPLLHDGKIVGVATFTIGNFFDPSLGYGVLIGDVQSFVEASRTKQPIASQQKYDLAGYRRQLDTINQQYSLRDQVLQMSIDPDFEVKNYEPQVYVNIVPRDSKRTQIDGMELFVIPTPVLKTQSDFVYFLQGLGVFDKSMQKLITTEVGGMTAYQPVYLQDASQGDALDERYYIMQPNERVVVLMVVAGDFGDAVYGVQREQQLQRLISGINLDPARSYTPPRVLVLRNPVVAIGGLSQMSPLPRWGRGLISLGSLHEYIAVNVGPLESRDADELDDRFEAQTQGVQDDQKNLISVKGRPGYIVCSDTTLLPSSFDFGDDGMSVGGWTLLPTDVAGRTLTQGRCRIAVVIDTPGSQQDRMVSFELVAQTVNLSRHLTTLIGILRNNTALGSSGSTTIPHLLKQRVELLYRDIDDQSDERKNVLRILTKYGLLQNDESLDATDVMTRRSFMTLVLRRRYRLTLDDPQVKQALQGLKIRRDEPVVSDQASSMIELIHLRLAGVRLADESMQGLQRRSQTKTNHAEQSTMNQVQIFEQKMYGEKKIVLSELLAGERGRYQPLMIAVGVPGKGVQLQPAGDPEAIEFGMDENRRDAIRFAGCFKSARDLLKSQCLQVVQDVMIQTLSYRVLTKGEAIDLLVDEVDFALFDPSLAVRKQATID